MSSVKRKWLVNKNKWRVSVWIGLNWLTVEPRGGLLYDDP